MLTEFLQFMHFYALLADSVLCSFAWCLTLALILLLLALTCMAVDTDSSIIGEFCVLSLCLK